MAEVGLASAALRPLQKNSFEGRSSTGNLLYFKNMSTERINDNRVPGQEPEVDQNCGSEF